MEKTAYLGEEEIRVMVVMACIDFFVPCKEAAIFWLGGRLGIFCYYQNWSSVRFLPVILYQGVCACYLFKEIS